MTIWDTRHAVLVTPKIIEICRPLQKLGVDFFCQRKAFKDNSETLLATGANWVKHYYYKKCSAYDVKYATENKFEHFIWLYYTKGTDITQQARNIANIFYGASFIDSKNEQHGFWEDFGFALSTKLLG